MLIVMNIKIRWKKNKKYLEKLIFRQKNRQSRGNKATAQEELDKAYAEIEENENKLLSAQKRNRIWKRKVTRRKKTI